MPSNPFSKYGRLARLMPAGSGKLFVVVPSGSAIIPELSVAFPTDEDGVVRVYTSLSSAVGAVVSNRGDVVAVMPGSYTISTVVSSSANNWKLIGVGAPGAAMLTGSSASILTLTGDGVEVANMGFTIASAFKGITMTGADFCDIHDNLFVGVDGGTASHFIHMVTTACKYNRIRDNQFISALATTDASVTQTSHITGLGTGNLIERNVFVAGRTSTSNAGAVTDGIIFNAAADLGNTIRQNTFYEANGATFTAGINSGASAVSGSILPVRNDFLLGTAANAIVNTTGSAGFGNNVANGTV